MQNEQTWRNLQAADKAIGAAKTHEERLAARDSYEKYAAILRRTEPDFMG